MTLEFLSRAQLPLTNVGATGKGTAAAAQYGDIGIVICIEARQRGGHLAHHVVIDSVQLVRTIQRYRRDVIAALVLDQRLRHWASLASSGSNCAPPNMGRQIRDGSMPLLRW